MSDASTSPTVLLVKLGGSLITDKTVAGTVRVEELRRLAGELAAGVPAARRRGVAVVLGHGSGSFGHVVAAEHGVAAGLPAGAGEEERERVLRGASLTQAVAAELHVLVLTVLREEGLAPFSVAPSSTLVTDEGRPSGFPAEPLARALRSGLLPVLYGDVVVDRSREVAIASTETVFHAVARALPEQGLQVGGALWLGRTPGLLDAAGRTVDEVRPEDAASRRLAGAAEGTDVTGGMAHRLESALALARLGVPSRIADGSAPGLLRAALEGEPVPGTLVPAAGPAAASASGGEPASASGTGSTGTDDPGAR